MAPNVNPYNRPWIYDRALGALLLGVNLQCIHSEFDAVQSQVAEDGGSASMGIYWFTITNYGNPSAIQHSPWTISLASTDFDGMRFPEILSTLADHTPYAVLRHGYSAIIHIFMNRLVFKAKDDLSPALAFLTLFVVLLSLADLGGAVGKS
ncbi:uncharacterized protein B0H18DRAFT_952581 [Fomitopsis serialis]|uniref:uncharacterized protein n=1 Tax=Fomitopsis serialis TaxID=139415 RepID=UPI0020088A41|nr:uncharacterized protein B0H18DRAFT_952581 [Neoantrodia serialis]KAH9931923.1 hypothetical protein B0H18DRAFT_952581 [Neoantrodia serialis]